MPCLLTRYLLTISIVVTFGVSLSHGATFDSAVVAFEVINVAALSRPCCVSTAPQAFDCFVRGPTSNVLHLIKHKESKSDLEHLISKREVKDLGGTIKNDIECLSTDMGIILLAIDTNNSLIWKRQTSGQWSEWMSLGQSLQEVPSCVVRGLSIDCLGRGTHGKAMTIGYENDGWGKWSEVQGTMASPPGCTVDADDVIHCFSVDGVNTPQVLKAKNHEWGEWRKLDEFSKSKERPCVFAQSDGKATSVFLDFYQSLKIVNEHGGGKLPTEPAKAPPECLAFGMGQDFCVGIGEDSYLYRLENGTYINSWLAFGFQETPSCAITDEAEVTCVIRGISRNLMEVVYRPEKSIMART